MNFAMNHAPGAGSIARPVDQKSSMLCTTDAPPPPHPHYPLLGVREMVLGLITQTYSWSQDVIMESHNEMRSNECMKEINRKDMTQVNWSQPVSSRGLF